MRFAAFLGTRDEADILPVAIEQLRHIGVELIVVMDVGSTDGTLAYLAEAEAAGDIWVFHDQQSEADSVRQAASDALVRSCEAEWVLFLDSDEIALPMGGTLHDLEDLDEYDILSVPRYNVVLGPDGPHMPARATPEHYDEVLLYAQPIPDFYHHMQREPETPWIRGVLEPKVLARIGTVAGLHRGVHDVEPTTGSRWRRGVSRDLLLAHLPFRDLERFEMRSANVRAVVDADPETYSGWTAWQWQRFAQMDREGRVREEYDRQVVDADELASLRQQGVVRTVAEVFAEPITSVDSDEAWMSMAARAEPWLAATGLVSRREHIQPNGKLEHLSGAGRYPVVLLPPDHVVKYYGPWCGGHESSQRELLALRLLETDPTLPVPRVDARGELRRDLSYVVMTRMAGVPLGSIDYELSRIERIAVASWTGDFVRRLQAVPLAKQERADGWGYFEKTARERSGQVETFATDRGFTRQFVERLSDWFPPLEELMGAANDGVLCHGQLDAGNILGRPTQPHFEPTGIVGFHQSCVGHPLADLGAVWWHLLEQDRDALRAFLRTSGLRERGGPDFPRRALAWTLMAPLLGVTRLEDAASVTDPDELAEHWFGR